MCTIYDCISELNNTQVDNAKDLDVVMPLYNLMEYSNNYAKTSGSLWLYHNDGPNDNMIDSESFNCKSRLTNNTNNVDVVNAEIAVPLKYLSNFWRTLEMPLISYEINLILT